MEYRQPDFPTASVMADMLFCALLSVRFTGAVGVGDAIVLLLRRVSCCVTREAGGHWVP